jgi:phage shock protein PspC (stress-responsive transcriptional regulator)
VSGDEVRDLGRLRRSRTNRKVAGVAGGLARHLDIDPLVLRVVFVVLVFFGGAGLILYGACWLLVPEDGSDRAAIHLDERSRTVALLIIGALAALALVGDSWGAFWFPWPIALVALVALWLLTRNSSAPPPPPAAYPPYQPYPPAAYPAAYPTDAAAGAAPVAPADPADPVAPQATAPLPAYGPAQPSAQSYGQTYPQSYAQTYAQPYAQPYAYVPPAPYVRPPNPRKRGPILFWFTLALIALAEGLLGIIDVAGADVPVSAYPALAVGICGLMLVVGAFFGRAGGIILIGLICAGALGLTTLADRWETEPVTVAPTTAASVDSRYWLGNGEQVLDLSGITDPVSLDGRRIEVEGGIGRIQVILPMALGAKVVAHVDGPGHLMLFGNDYGGIDVRKVVSEGNTFPRVTIDAQLGVGEIEVIQR